MVQLNWPIREHASRHHNYTPEIITIGLLKMFEKIVVANLFKRDSYLSELEHVPIGWFQCLSYVPHNKLFFWWSASDQLTRVTYSLCCSLCSFYTLLKEGLNIYKKLGIYQKECHLNYQSIRLISCWTLASWVLIDRCWFLVVIQMETSRLKT